MNERTRELDVDAEVELDAVELVRMAHTSDAPAPTQGGGKNGRSMLLRVAVPTGLLLAAVAAGSTLLIRTPETNTVALVTAQPAAVMPDWVTQEIEPEPQSAEPVRFANPFDQSEVFEFPAGTSKEEARDAVAALLLERAMKRRATDPKLSRGSSS